MRHVINVLRQVALVAPKAHRMSSQSNNSKITACQRGAFILFEGGDRCGKTTQSQSLVDHLKASGVCNGLEWYTFLAKPQVLQGDQLQAGFCRSRLTYGSFLIGKQARGA